MPPEYYVGALHDPIHKDIGRNRPGRSIKVNTSKLAVKDLTVKVVEASDLNALVKEVYGEDFNFHRDYDLDYNSDLDDLNIYCEFEVKASDFNDDICDRICQFVITGDHEGLTRALLIDLCGRGVIEPGNYLIQS